MTKDIGMFGFYFSPYCRSELLQSDSDNTNTDRRRETGIDDADSANRPLGGSVKFSLWSNCLVTDPMFDLTGWVSFLSHP